MKRTSRLLLLLPTRAQTCVIKNNGIFERFTHEKIVKSCLMVGAPLWAAEKISSYVAKAAYDGISTAEIKMLVYDCLKRVDGKTADKYLASNTLRVRTSRDTIEPFDQRKIEKNSDCRNRCIWRIGEKNSNRNLERT